MTRTYRLRGIEQDTQGAAKAGVSVPGNSSNIDVSRLRRLVPGTARDAGVTEVEAAGDLVRERGRALSLTG